MKLSLNDNGTGKVLDEPEALIEDEQSSSGWKAYQDEKTGLFGFKDDDEIVIEAKYEEAWDFYGGRAIVKVKPKESELTLGVLGEGVYGLIDPAGNYVIEPKGYIVRVDTWRYLATGNLEFWKGYGLNGDAVVKYNFVNGNGEKKGEALYYYVYPVDDDIFVVNNGLKSYFIDREGKAIPKYSDFYFPIQAEKNGNKIIVTAMDDHFERLKWYLPLDGTEMETIRKSESLAGAITYKTQILSTYIGSSLFFPEFSMENPDVQSKLNQIIFENAKKTFGEGTFGPNELVDLAQVDHIDSVVNFDFELSTVGKLMNYESHGSFYGLGAAHPNAYWETLHYNLDTGEELKLESLFKPDVNWKQVIATFADAQFMNDTELQLMFNSETPVEERISALALAQFSLTFSNDKVTVHYMQYEVGPYAAGFPTCEIPYEALAIYFDKESDFYKAIYSVQ